MSRAPRVAALVLAVTSLPGCDSHAYYDEATKYANLTTATLIASGRCQSDSECSKKELVFFEAGGISMGSLRLGGVHINVYQESDAQFVKQLADNLTALKAQIGGPSVTLTVYRNAHLETPVRFQEVVVK